MFEFEIGVCGVVQDAVHDRCVVGSKRMQDVGGVRLQLSLHSGKVTSDCVNKLTTCMREGQVRMHQDWFCDSSLVLSPTDDSFQWCSCL